MVRLLALIASFAALACNGISDPPSQRLNVLFIAVDDLRPELGTYGAQTVTPHIDRLAAEGIRFDRAFTEVPACAASRASMMTGTYSQSTRVPAMYPALSEANPALITMPKLFRDAGYETVEIGKFQHQIADSPNAWSQPRWLPELPQPQYEAPENRHHSGVRNPRGPISEAADVPDDVYIDGRLAVRAVEQLREMGKRPFFMGLGFYRPHLPHNCPKKYWDLYDRDRIQLREDPDLQGAAQREFHGNYELGIYSDVTATDPATSRRMIHSYRACVSYVDAQIGLVLHELERSGLAERTIVVLWGDHGWHLGEHGIWGKFTLLEPSLRIPLIMRVPGRIGGNATSGFVETVDILPTLCELTGIEIPPQVEGLSFVALLDDPMLAWKQAVFGSRRVITDDFPLAALTVRTPRFRLVRWYQDARQTPREFELYDHKSDPAENVNLAGDPAHRPRITSLNAMIDAWSRGEPVGHPR